MNEEITDVKPPMGFPHITDLAGSEATILQVANSQGDILGYATLDDIDAYIEQKVSETVHSFSQKQTFQDVTINGTIVGSGIDALLADYYNKQSVDNLCQKRGHWWGNGKGTVITLPSDANAVYLLMYGYKSTMRNYGLIFNQFAYGSSDLFYYDVLKQDNWFITPTVEKDDSNIKVTIGYGDGSIVNIIRLA